MERTPRVIYIAGSILVICFAVLASGCAGSGLHNNADLVARNASQFLYATNVTGEIGSTQTNVTAFRVEGDGSLTTLGTAFTLGPGISSWETFSLQMADATGHHVFGIESVSLLEPPFSTTYSLITLTVQPETGALQQTSSLVLPGEPTTLVLNPAGTLMFVGLFGGQTMIASYSVDNDGRLTPIHTTIPGFQFAVYATVVDPKGNFLYAIGGGPHGYGFGIQFAIDSAGGLMPVSNFSGDGTPFSAGNPGAAGAADVIVTPTGHTLYSLVRGQIKIFSVDPVSGQLTEGASVPCLCFSVATNPQGNLLFAGTYSLTQPVGISVFNIEPNTEALLPLNNSLIQVAPFNASLVFVPWFVLDSSGRFLYTTAFGLSDILGFSVSETGVVTPVQGSPVAGSPFTQAGANALTLVTFKN